MKFINRNFLEVKNLNRKKQASRGAVTGWVAFLLISGILISGEAFGVPNSRKTSSKIKPVVQKLGTFVLTYSPKSLSPPKGAKKVTPATELKCLLESVAKIKTDRPLEYRNQIIVAGEHAVKMVQDKKSYYFILGTPPKKAVNQKPSKRRKSTEKKLEATGKTMGLAEREKSSEKIKSTKKKDSSNPKTQEEKTKGQSWLKARVFFSVPRAVKSSSKVTFKLEAVSGGKKLRLIAQAGKTLGKATFKVHPKEVKSAKKKRKRK